jgi:hypothetical protein
MAPFLAEWFRLFISPFMEHLIKPVLFGPQVGESQPPDGAWPEDQV